MTLHMKNIHLENCVTGIKAEGNVDIDAKDLTIKNNIRDIDFSITKESNINLENIFAQGSQVPPQAPLKKYSKKKTLAINV